MEITKNDDSARAAGAGSKRKQNTRSVVLDLTSHLPPKAARVTIVFISKPAAKALIYRSKTDTLPILIYGPTDTKEFDVPTDKVLYLEPVNKYEWQVVVSGFAF